MHEIITLQLGSAANFVGAHFWNLQDEAVAASAVPGCEQAAASIDHNMLCAWSEDAHVRLAKRVRQLGWAGLPLCSPLLPTPRTQGVASYAPRTVVLDLSGALGGA
jgi:hypothetical protein